MNKIREENGVLSCESNRRKSAAHLYALLWSDGIERYDTVMMEARHLQQSIIHSLREPVFYQPLAWEESRILGSEWPSSPSASNVSEQWIESAKIAANTILLFPPPPDAAAVDHSAPQNHIKAERHEAMLERLYICWFEGVWAREQKRHYHVLRGIQQLKRELLRDKILLCLNAHSGGLLLLDGKERKKANFVILRRGLLVRINQYVQRLQDFKRQFNQAMDTGRQDHPRPSVERRRELGIYMDFLSGRTRDLHRDMHMLLDAIKAPKVKRGAIVLHGWAHSEQSTTNALLDECSESLRYESGDIYNESLLSTNSAIEFVNTNFWMPERPDLQPIIAHETAHAIIRTRYDNLSDSGLGKASDSFSRLLQDIYSAIEQFSLELNLPLGDKPRSVVTEIACDLLAVSAKGSSYLYAMFIELIGNGLEKMLVSPKGVVEPVLADHVVNNLFDHEVSKRDWYYRLKIAVYWWRRINHHTSYGYHSVHAKPSMQDTLADGIESVSDALLDYVSGCANPGDGDDSILWHSFTERMCELIDRNEKAYRAVREWRLKRSKDDLTEYNNKGKREFPRSSRRLSPWLRQRLFWAVLQDKCHGNRPLGKLNIDDDASLNAFSEFYGLTINTTKIDGEKLRFPGMLYCHLYDIPWQSALMRARDILYGKMLSFSESIRVLHHDFSAGRDLYELALEFFLWDSDSAHHRLSNAIGAVSAMIMRPSIMNNHVVQAWLMAWRGRAITQSDIAKLVSKINWIGRGALRDVIAPNGSVTVSARSLNAAIGRASPLDAELYRKLEKIAGYKLEELSKFLKGMPLAGMKDVLRVGYGRSNKIASVGEVDRLTIDNYVKPLIEYLDIRSNERESSGKRFYSILLNSLCPPVACAYESDSGVVKYAEVSMYSISRISMCGSHDGVDKRKSKKYSLSLYGALRQEPHDFEISLPGSDESYRIEPLLGRYDALMYGKVRPMCRCPLPGFESSYANEDARRFPSFFTRREIGVEFDLRTQYSGGHDKRELFAVMAVTLQRRASRLEFVYRLMLDSGCLAARNGRTIFCQYDKGFLSDGWGDLLFFLYDADDGRKNESRIDDIFWLQNSFYEDFLVDRTELIFTPHALDIVAELPKESPYQIRAQIRLQETRDLSQVNSEFEETVAGKMRLFLKNNSAFERTVVSKAPGRMDYYIRFSKKHTYNGAAHGGPRKFYAEMLDLLGEPYMDRLDTAINRRRIICDTSRCDDCDWADVAGCV